MEWFGLRFFEAIWRLWSLKKRASLINYFDTKPPKSPPFFKTKKAVKRMVSDILMFAKKR
jgi:hypothetical protein